MSMDLLDQALATARETVAEVERAVAADPSVENRASLDAMRTHLARLESAIAEYREIEDS